MQTVSTPKEVLSFWFGAPARDAAALIAKQARWFQGGEAFDAPIRARFLPTIEAALVGRLDRWADSADGRLALIVLLDQLARHAYRNHPRAFAAAPLTQRWALEVVHDASLWAYDSEEQIFAIMPLVHAEDLPLLVMAAELTKSMVERAPAALAPALEPAIRQVEHYKDIIARFGRYPHRNALLGRPSTEQERAFLASHTPRVPAAVQASAIEQGFSRS